MYKLVSIAFTLAVVAVASPEPAEAAAGDAPSARTTGEADKRGCCSHHGGVCGCAGGRATCCDGQVSPSCGCAAPDASGSR